MDILSQISECLKKGDRDRVFFLTQQAIDQNLPPGDILDNGLIAGMNVIGELFRTHQIFLPDVLMAAKAMYAGMDLLKPLMIETGVSSRGKIVIGTVQGDLHDIGKNLVGILLKGAGFDVIDLGKDVHPDTFVKAAQTEHVDIIGMSALLTTTMPVMKEVTDLLKEKRLNKSIKTIVGGAPTSQEYAREIGANAYAYDAANAVEKVKQLLEK